VVVRSGGRSPPWEAPMADDDVWETAGGFQRPGRACEMPDTSQRSMRREERGTRIVVGGSGDIAVGTGGQCAARGSPSEGQKGVRSLGHVRGTQCSRCVPGGVRMPRYNEQPCGGALDASTRGVRSKARECRIWSGQRLFDRGFLEIFELCEETFEYRSSSSNYPLQHLQRQSYVSVNGLAWNA
jgi:hypothetical protein